MKLGPFRSCRHHQRLRSRSAPVAPLVIALLYGLLPAASAGQTPTFPAAKRYRITIWVLRPLVNKAPTMAELRRFHAKSKWINGLIGVRLPPNDRVILASLRRANPQMEIGNITEKVVADIEPDREWNAPLQARSKFAITIVVAGRERAMTDATATWNPSSAAAYKARMAKELLLYQVTSIPSDTKEEEAERVKLGHAAFNGKRSKGYVGAEPNVVRAVDPGLSYDASLAGEKNGKPYYKVRQRVRDLILYSVQPLP